MREATLADLPAVVAMLLDDVLGRTREAAGVDEAYTRAFHEIDADPRNHLMVAVAGEEVVGCLQITYIPGLGHHGAERSLIEAVRVRGDLRGQGIGEQMMTWCIDQARARGCAVVQLTTNKQRLDAHRFYHRLGFVSSHEGMKLAL